MSDKDNFAGNPFADDDAGDDADNFTGDPFAKQPVPAKRQPDSVLSRIGTGLADPIYGAAQLADKVIDPVRQRLFPGASNMQDVIKQRDAEYQAPEGVDWARMAGNIANPVTWAGGGAGVLRATGQGAFQAGLTPVSPDESFATEKAKQVGMGAAGGAVLAKALSGLRSTPEAQALMKQGVQPTVGQSLGGMANTVEQKLASVPFVGDAINYARRRAQNEFEAAVLQRAVGTPPLATSHGVVERATKRAPKTLDEASAIASQKFADVVPHLNVTEKVLFAPHEAMEKALENPEMTGQAKRILRGLVAEYLDPNKVAALDAEGLKNLDSQLGYLIRKYAAGDPASQTLADEIRKVQNAYRKGLNDALPKELQGGLDAANTAWAKMVPIHKAASSRADEKITPRALQRAMANQQRVDASRLPHDALVDNAISVLGQTVADSGTAGRLMLGGGGLVGSGALGWVPEYLTAGGAAYVGATRPVQRALLGNTAWQKALAPYDTNMAALIAAALRTKGQKDE